MSLRSCALVLTTFVALAGAVPALAQDFDFVAVPRITVGLTNQGPVGTLCATGLVNFARSTGPGTVKGTVTSASEVPCGGDPFEPFTFNTGSLTLFTGNNSVVGTLGGERLIGQLLPFGHGLIAIDTFTDSGNALIDGVGLTVLIERGGATFTQSNLTGTWRIKALSGEQGFAPGTSQTAFGFVTFNAAGLVTGGSLTYPFFSEPIVSGNVTVMANGQLAGFIETSDGDVSTFIDVQGLMAPDKNFIAGVSITNGFSSFENGMFFMQREPTGTTFTTANLAGVWNVFSLQSVADDSSAGNVFRGTLTFDSAGTIIGSNLQTGDGFSFPPVDSGGFFVDAQGFISGELTFVNEAFLSAQATMFKEKNQIIGVNTFGDGFDTTFGLFVMFRQGPPPPASVVQFRLGNYSVQEGMPASITLDRTGATTTAVTVDFVAVDPLLDGSPATRTLSFAPGQSSLTFAVPTAGDPFRGPDRRLNLVLSNPTNGATLGARSTANLNVLDDDSTFDFAQTAFMVSEKAGKATIKINRVGALAFPASVLFTATPGTAGADRDFTFVSRNVSFAKGMGTATVEVPVKDNMDLDGNRSVVLQLFPPTVLVARPGLPKPTLVGLNPTAMLIITDDDTPGVVSLSSATYSGDEGKGVVITIVRAPATPGALLGGNVSVPYFTSDNSSAISGLDYTAVEGSVTFTGRETMKIVTLPQPTQDDRAEGSEHFLFNLGTPGNGATLGRFSTARVNINDVDRGGVVSLSADKYSVGEGAGNISITVRRLNGNANVSVVLTTGGGSATAGEDYGSVSTTVVFGPGETTKIVVIPIFQDLVAEGDETFGVELSNPQGGATLGTPFKATVTIVDDESSIRFSQAAFSAKEGTRGVVTVVRSGALGTASVVPFNISSISAFPGVDFTPPVSSSLTFPPQVKQLSIMIPTINNTNVDGNRSVAITLGTPTGGAQLASPSTATFTIVDDDQPGEFRMGSATYRVREGNSVLVEILRAPAAGNGGPLGGNISVSYATVSGNASAGEDFKHIASTVVFGPTETRKTVTVETLNNTLVEPVEDLAFVLSAPTGGATLGAPSRSTILIDDDDSAGMVFFSQSAYKVSESAGSVDITVMRTGGTANASVQFRTIAGTAGFQLGSPAVPAIGASGLNDIGWVVTTLFFGAGEMRKTVSVPILNDNIGEGDEVFFVVLQNPQGGLRLGSPSNSSVTIVDDEVVVQFSGKFKNNQPEVVRTGPTGANVSVQYFATSGTAILGEDFRLRPGTLVFGPGVTSRTIPIEVFNDNFAEGAESFTITLLNPSPPAQLGPNFEQAFALDDNDFGGTLNFANTSPKVTLGSTQSMMVRRTGGAGTVMTVGWAAIGGTAVPGTDFWPAAGQFTYQAGDAVQGFSVEISAAPSAAGKTIVFGLMPPGLDTDFKSSRLGTANISTVTIMGAPPSVIQFSKATYSVAEDQGVATITVKRTGDLSQPATVNYATSNGTATTLNEDYSPASGTLTFPASDGSYQVQSFTVGITDDGQAEGTETVNLTLGNVSASAVLGERSTAVLEINDPQGPYNFTVLYSGGVNVGLPSINDAGVFSFLVNAAQQTVFTGNIDTPSNLRTALTVPDALVSGLPGVRTPVDSGETVAAVANLPSGGAGIVLGFNNSPNVVFSSSSGVSEPAYSLDGKLAFKGVDDCDGPCDALFLGTGSGVTVAVREGDTVSPGVDVLNQIRNSAAVNDNGVAAFVGTTFGGAIGVYTTSGGGAISTVSSTVDETYVQYGHSLSINNFGAVAFVGVLPDGSSSVVVGFGGSTTPIATTSPGGFVAFNDSNSASPAIANTELVAFVASLADESEGIFTGPDPVAHKVVRTGDIIDGRTVIDVALGGINTQGQISFRALLYDGQFFEQAAIVATPAVRCDCPRPPLERP